MIGGLDTFDLIQIGLNVALLICLSLLLLWVRRGGGPGADSRRLYKSAEEFLTASEELASRLEDNLREKRVLINELVGELDAKTAQMKGLLKQADQAAANLTAGLRVGADREPGPGRQNRPGPGPPRRGPVHLPDSHPVAPAQGRGRDHPQPPPEEITPPRDKFLTAGRRPTPRPGGHPPRINRLK